MKNKILSIIVPSYNTAKYIDSTIPTMLSIECINDIEILIINDGSKDETSNVARKYEKTHPNCVKVIDKENGGHGSVINRGIKEATGKYFKVIDGDDYVDTNEFIRFIEILKTIDVDACISLYRTVSAINGKEVIMKPDSPSLVKDKFDLPYNRTYSIDDVFEKVYGTIHSITFRTEILKNNYNNVKVQEGVFYEDNEYCLYPMAFVESIYITDCDVYRYVVDQAGQSISVINRQNRLNHNYIVVTSMIKHYETLFLKNNHARNDYAKRAIARQIYAVYETFFTFDNKFNDRRKALKKFDLSIKSQNKELYNEVYQYRAVKILRMTNYWVYGLLRVLYLKRQKKPRG